MVRSSDLHRVTAGGVLLPAHIPGRDDGAGELTAHLDLPLDSRTPARARRAVTAILGVWQLDDAIWLREVVLVVSELAANAVRHGGGEISLDLQVDGGTLTIGARDGN